MQVQENRFRDGEVASRGMFPRVDPAPPRSYEG